MSNGVDYHLEEKLGNKVGCNGQSTAAVVKNSSSECLADRRLESVHETAEFLQSKTKCHPAIAIICGTGFGSLADCVKDREYVDYSEIPNFVACTVPGHAGRLVFGALNGVEVVLMQGRPHAYEDHSMWQLTFPVRVMAGMGVRVLIATNACGGINPQYSVGDLMIMKDHINLPGLGGLNPLIGVFDDRFGTRFPCLNGAYERRLRVLAWRVGRRLGLQSCLHEGVYLVQCGPCYETPAELRMIRNMGADVVGMSTAPEVIVARQCGMLCFGLSLVANMCILDDDDASAADSIDDDRPDGPGPLLPLGGDSDCGAVNGANHDEVLDAGLQRAADIKAFLVELVAEIARSQSP